MHHGMSFLQTTALLGPFFSFAHSSGSSDARACDHRVPMMESTVAGIVVLATYQSCPSTPTKVRLTRGAFNAHERCESGPAWANSIDCMTSKRVHITLTTRQVAVLDKLARKLLLGRAEVIRLAVARLAETEQIKP